ncbi:hypothetical protein L1987_16565 [Smallanthus sonchifolius]|uniref:Uncharacterized protein n=1 Tax=Smallanthus sonchifolius TaxID=185202 RepID=A0ACB9IUC2_9ASTR|nr:hypothetical protein L1987_16565 [Smallanthus sonchifolius]
MHESSSLDVGGDVQMPGNETVIMKIAPVYPNRDEEITNGEVSRSMDESEGVDKIEQQKLFTGMQDQGNVNATEEVIMEEGMTPVFLNKEYTGDSILDNLSTEEVISLLVMITSRRGRWNPAVFSQMENVVAWDRLNEQRVTLSWLEIWGDSTGTDLFTRKWENTMQVIRSYWAMEYGEGTSDLHQASIFSKQFKRWDLEAKFFTETNTMVECLAKWEGQYNSNDHEMWRKMPGEPRAPNWLDVERDACNQEEIMHRNKLKKRKNKGRNPFRGHKTTPSGEGENLSRRTIRVISSKERHKDMFPQNVPIPTVMPPPLGFSKFRMGSDLKEKHKKQESQTPARKRLDSLYKDLMAKEIRLKEIAMNILKTDTNSALLQSILSMKTCKLRKFSAKVDAQGVVTIDKDMVDTGSGDTDPNISHPGAPVASYARTLTGEQTDSPKEKVQYYPPLGNKGMIGTSILRVDITGGGTTTENDGFTLVTGRRNGIRRMSQGSRNNNNLNNNQNGSRNVREGARTENRNKRDNIASTSMANKNIVINGQNLHGTQDRGNERELRAQEKGTSNNSDSPITDSTGLNCKNPTVSILDKGKPSSTPDVRIVETSNRFLLLDEEGNEPLLPLTQKSGL